MTLKIKPSARINRRYLFIEGRKEDIEKAILDYIGILGWAKASPFFIKNEANKIILAIDRKSINDIRAAFELCKDNIEIPSNSVTLQSGISNRHSRTKDDTINRNVYIKILKVSGTLKGLKKRII